MGYRSQVRGLIYGPHDKMLAFITRLQIEGSKVFEHNEDALKQRTRGDMTFLDLTHDDVKWYEHYDDVKSWEDAFNLAIDEMGLNGEFIRIGEEETDIETSFMGEECEYLLGVHSEITDNAVYDMEEPADADI